MKKIFSNTRGSLRLFFVGFAMGSADVVPGVSGGTIAFIFGVFEELVFSIKKISGDVLRSVLRLQIRKAIKDTPFGFLIPLAVGIFTAIFSLSSVISSLLQNHPVYIWSFFLGLMIASIWIVKDRVVKWNSKIYFSLLLGALFAYLLVGLVPVETPATLFAFFLSGMVAICAMILPGVSGSFLLIMLGKYSQVLSAVVNREYIILLTVVLGAVVGLALFSRVLSWLFEKYHDLVVAALTGLMIGALRKIWPWKEVVETRINSHGVEVPLTEINYLPPSIDTQVIYAVGFMLLAVVIMFYLDSLQVVDEDSKK